MPERIISATGFSTTDPKLVAFHHTRGNPQKAICIKDSPEGTYIDYHEYKKGDIVTVNGLTCTEIGRFEVAIPEVYGFYDATHFELIENKNEKSKTDRPSGAGS